MNLTVRMFVITKAYLVFSEPNEDGFITIKDNLRVFNGPNIYETFL